MTIEQRKTPAGQDRGISEELTHHSLSGDSSSVADSVSQGEVFAQQSHGIYILVAQIQSESGKRFRRRFYANLPSAQRAVDRAIMQGREAHLLIGQVSIVDGDAQ